MSDAKDMVASQQDINDLHDELEQMTDIASALRDKVEQLEKQSSEARVQCRVAIVTASVKMLGDLYISTERIEHWNRLTEYCMTGE